MSDRSSAALFADIFALIDKHVEDPRVRKTLAEEFWEKTCDYDFSKRQMDCDEVLVRLGLARETVDDGETVIEYGPL